MRRQVFTALIFLLVSMGFQTRASICLGADSPPPEGGVLPEISLPVSQSMEEKQYLGLGEKSSTGSFKIPQIKADIVVVEVFNMYCPFCQREAPVVNELYDKIKNSPDLKERVKIVGIGAGNSAYEVNIFKNKYGVSFPLFTDADFSLHNALGKVKTPYFLGIKVNRDGSHKVIYSKVGTLGDPQQFLDLLVARSKTE